MRHIIALLASGLVLAACAQDRLDFAAAPASAPEARIDFVQYRGVFEWQAVNDRLLYAQSRERDWYEVRLLPGCVGLPYAQAVQFLPSDPAGHFDRFGSIRVSGETCKVMSVKAVPAPERVPYSAVRN